MANIATKLRLPSMKETQWQILAGPVLIITILAMMILPLPPFILDLLFTFNIVLSIMILLVAMFTQNTLEFSAFPTVLLFSTLLRLALNVASTRVILMQGHTGAGAAGQVVEAFGHFLVGGNFAIGIIVFVILIIINFMVITKGAGRIAEVGARFSLDGMPGKQMAIDADLNAGLIGEDEAKRRRKEVTQEADFYGSMDGASKFVRGDAIAGLMIMAINIIGGLIIGMTQHDMSAGMAGETYTLLTIGDGLVAQIPGLVISTAAGVVVTRVANEQDVGEQMVGQLFTSPRVLLLAAVVIGMLGIIPGMPNFVFLLFTVVLLTTAWWLRGQQGERKKKGVPGSMQHGPQVDEIEASQVNEATWADVQMEDELGLEVGYRLIPMVDQAQNGQLLTRVRGIRKKFAQQMGFLPPAVHIRDNLDLPPTRYRILLKGVEIGHGEIQPDRWMAIDPGCAEGNIPGTACTEPTFGLPAMWIDEVHRELAQTLGYTVVDPSSVVATHLNQLISTHTEELFGRQEAQQLLDQLSKHAPKLVDDLIPAVISLTILHKVLQNLLAERVPIRDMRTIIDTLAEFASATSDADDLTARVRARLARAITQQWFPGDDDIQVIGLDLSLEQLLVQATQSGSAIEPGIAENLMKQTEQALMHQEGLGAPPVLLVTPPLRLMLSRYLRRMFPQLAVLSSQEINSQRNVRMTWMIGSKYET
jgi:flagellar biosynthesis protein FlhA